MSTRISATPAMPPTTPPTTDCCVGVNAGPLPPPPPPDPLDVAAATSEVAVAPAPACPSIPDAEFVAVALPSDTPRPVAPLELEVDCSDCELLSSVEVARIAGNKVPLTYDTSSVAVVVIVTVVSAVIVSLKVLLRASDNTEPAGLGIEVADSSGGGVVVELSPVTGTLSLVESPISTEIVTEPRFSRETTVSLETGGIVVVMMVEEPSLTLMTTSSAATVTVSSVRRLRVTDGALRPTTARCRDSVSPMVGVGANAPRLSESSLRMPSSEVKSPSAILEPGSRGDLASGSSILIRFDGGSILSL